MRIIVFYPECELIGPCSDLGAEAEWTKEKRQRVDEDVESVAVEEVSGSKEI